jgi:CRP/FNR family transcriptional regulator
MFPAEPDQRELFEPLEHTAKNSCSFKGWSAEENNLLAAINEPQRRYAARSELYRQGFPCPTYFILLEGWVGVRVTLDDGASFMPDCALPGTLLGVQPVAGRAMSHSAVCLTPVSVIPLPRERFDRLSEEYSRFGLRLAHFTACREARLQDHFVNVSGRGARERVAHLLIELFYRTRRRLPVNGDSVQLPLTLAHLGQATGLSEVHVSRVLTILRVQGAIRFSRHRLEVLDADAFRRAAAFDLDEAVFGDEIFSEVVASGRRWRAA